MQKTRTGIAFRLVAKCSHCGLSSFGADQSNCPPLLECVNQRWATWMGVQESARSGSIRTSRCRWLANAHKTTSTLVIHCNKALVPHEELIVENKASIVIERHVVRLAIVDLEAVLQEFRDIPEHAGKVSRILQDAGSHRGQVLAKWSFHTLPDMHLQSIVPIMEQFEETPSTSDHCIRLWMIGLENITRVIS